MKSLQNLHLWWKWIEPETCRQTILLLPFALRPLYKSQSAPLHSESQSLGEQKNFHTKSCEYVTGVET